MYGQYPPPQYPPYPPQYPNQQRPHRPPSSPMPSPIDPNTENWVDHKWRPAMSWMYLVVCVTDFIIFPVLHALFQSRYGTATLAWEPLTLKGGGLFHIAMGAVLGITSWSRGQEKMTHMESQGYRDRYYAGLGDQQQQQSYQEPQVVQYPPPQEVPPVQQAGVTNEQIDPKDTEEMEEITDIPVEPVANTQFYRYQQ